MPWNNTVAKYITDSAQLVFLFLTRGVGAGHSYSTLPGYGIIWDMMTRTYIAHRAIVAGNCQILNSLSS